MGNDELTERDLERYHRQLSLALDRDSSIEEMVAVFLFEFQEHSRIEGVHFNTPTDCEMYARELLDELEARRSGEK